MRHLILEGPDGGGKTRLAEAILAKHSGLTMAEKASSSLKGPVKNLAAWVRHQYDVMDESSTPLIYDRHPVISEPIYGPIARGGAQPGFAPSPWLSTATLNLQSRTFIIWCIPPLIQVRKAIANSRDMPGVTENIDAIHAAYLKAMVQWNGPGIRYDLTSMASSDVLPDGLFSGAVQFVDEFTHVFTGQVFRD